MENIMTMMRTQSHMGRLKHRPVPETSLVEEHERLSPRPSSRELLEKLEPEISANPNQEEEETGDHHPTSRLGLEHWQSVLETVDTDALIFPEAPAELTTFGRLDYSRWSFILTDVSLKRIARLARDRQTLRRSNLVDVAKVTAVPVTTALVAPGAEHITDIGLCAVANACPDLEILDLHKAGQITDTALRLVALRCPKLRQLNIGQCPSISGSGLRAVAESCHDLTELRLAHATHLSDVRVLQRFPHGCPTLRVLDLTGCRQLSDAVMTSVVMPSLIELHLSQCAALTDRTLFACGSHCPELRVLTLSGLAKLTDTGILSLVEGCPWLRQIDLAHCVHLSDVGVSWLAEHSPELRHVVLDGCIELTDVALHALGSYCPDLKHLSVAQVKKLSDIGLAYIAQSCPALQVLVLTNLYLISDGPRKTKNPGPQHHVKVNVGLAAIAGSCPQLRELSLAGCFQVSQRALESLMHCPNLVRVNLSGCRDVTERGLLAFARSCPALQSLNCTSCSAGMSNAVLLSLSRSCAQLAELSLGQCGRISNRGLVALSRNANVFRKLNFTACFEISNAGLNALSQEFSQTPGGYNLTHLILDACPKITRESISKLAYRCSALLTLSVKGCTVSKQTLESLKSSWKYTRLIISPKKVGFFATYRASDRRFIDEHGQLWIAALRIQSIFRTRRAQREFVLRREQALILRLTLFLQRRWRGKVGRRRALLHQCIFHGQEKFALKLQRAFRQRQKKALASSEIQQTQARDISTTASFVQHRFRRNRRQCLNSIQITRQLMELERLNDAAILVQRRYRGVLGRRVVDLALAQHVMDVHERAASATSVQSLFRQREARKALAHERTVVRVHTTRRMVSSLKIQRAWRAFASARALGAATAEVQQRHAAATRIQSRLRLRRTQARLDLARMFTQELARDRAAKRLQRHWRGRVDRKGLMLVCTTRRLVREQRRDAAREIQAWARRCRHQRRAREVSRRLAEAKQAQRDFVDWAISLIQKSWRASRSRRHVAVLRQAQVTSWKELLDWEGVYHMGTGAPFYFNQLSGDIRWRRPAVVASRAEDRPDHHGYWSCDQCHALGGVTWECSTCEEMFCTECHEIVHGGGKRKLHATRRLVDFYGKRIDYGDGDFPSVWPSEMAEDHARGYDFVQRVQKASYDDMVSRITQANLHSREQQTHDSTEVAVLPEDPQAKEFESYVNDNAQEWCKYLDEETNEYYYFNDIQQESTWERPEEYISPRADDAGEEEEDPLVSHESFDRPLEYERESNPHHDVTSCVSEDSIAHISEPKSSSHEQEEPQAPVKRLAKPIISFAAIPDETSTLTQHTRAKARSKSHRKKKVLRTKSFRKK